jgi:hypothetical protein
MVRTLPSQGGNTGSTPAGFSLWNMNNDEQRINEVLHIWGWCEVNLPPEANYYGAKYWCSENIVRSEYTNFARKFLFEHEKDAMLFALRWS